MLIESITATLTTFLLFVGLCSVSYYGLAREYSRYVGQEALVCLLETNKVEHCQSEAQHRLTSALQVAGDPYIRLSNLGKNKKAYVSYRPYLKSTRREGLKQTLSMRHVMDDRQ